MSPTFISYSLISKVSPLRITVYFILYFLWLFLYSMIKDLQPSKIFNTITQAIKIKIEEALFID